MSNTTQGPTPPPSRADLIAFLACIGTGAGLVLAAHAPAADVTVTASAVISAYTAWRSGAGRG